MAHLQVLSRTNLPRPAAAVGRGAYKPENADILEKLLMGLVGVWYTRDFEDEYAKYMRYIYVYEITLV